jgi:hypothetical protein
MFPFTKTNMADLNETLENETVATNAEEVLNVPVEQPLPQSEAINPEPAPELPSEPVGGDGSPEDSTVESEEETVDVATPEIAEETPAPLHHGEIDPAYNCVPCIGDGIVDNVVCSTCHGTGKV